MTRQRSFKRLVRARMEKTGERYAAARAALLAAAEPSMAEAPTMTVSDEVIRRRTGRGWEEWFDLLDDSGAIAKPHAEIARWLRSEHAVDGWSSQSITVSYERARGRRAIGETASGFTVSAQRTVAVPVDRLYDAFVDESLRERWLPDADLRERSASRPKSARFDWAGGDTRVVVWFEAKGDAKSTAAIQHERLADAQEAGRMKAYWRERVATLKEVLEQ